MNEIQKEFESTGYTSFINADLYPDGKIYTQEYTEWLEKRVKALSMSDVGGELICPNCDNPYPHTRTNDTHYCEECGHDWAD